MRYLLYILLLSNFSVVAQVYIESIPNMVWVPSTIGKGQAPDLPRAKMTSGNYANLKVSIVDPIEGVPLMIGFSLSYGSKYQSIAVDNIYYSSNGELTGVKFTDLALSFEKPSVDFGFDMLYPTFDLKEWNFEFGGGLRYSRYLKSIFGEEAPRLFERATPYSGNYDDNYHLLHFNSVTQFDDVSDELYGLGIIQISTQLKGRFDFVFKAQIGRRLNTAPKLYQATKDVDFVDGPDLGFVRNLHDYSVEVHAGHWMYSIGAGARMKLF